jgi:hypothetical protein
LGGRNDLETTAMALFGSGIWGILVVLGPVVLAVAIAWAMLRNRQSKQGLQRTERATHDLYQREDHDNKPHDGIDRP